MRKEIRQTTLLLSIVWHAFAPFLSLAILYLMILVFRSNWVRNIFNRQQVSYRPPEQAAPTPKPPPRTGLSPSFDLTEEEYRQLAPRYEQGYQAQPSAQSAHWSPFGEPAQPKQDRPYDYEQPQAQYPELPLQD